MWIETFNRTMRDKENNISFNDFHNLALNDNTLCNTLYRSCLYLSDSNTEHLTSKLMKHFEELFDNIQGYAIELLNR